MERRRRRWIAVLLLSLLVTGNDALHATSRPNSWARGKALAAVSTPPAASASPFWVEGLPFGCTSCGRCCHNEGEVWLDSDEFSDLVLHLKMPPRTVVDHYVDTVMNGWTRLKNNGAKDAMDDRCVFLGPDGKQCTIYEARPVQCRTYPFWPRLLTNQGEWDKEAVVPDDVEGKHWSAKDGGCEGINAPGAPVISAKVVHRNHELYKMYNDAHPFMTTGDDVNRLLAKVGVINGVVNATKAWVDRFVLQY